VEPSVWYWLSGKDFYGTPMTLVSNQRLEMDVTFSLGMSFFIANKKAALFAF
jgi:hypothetical protein